MISFEYENRYGRVSFSDACWHLTEYAGLEPVSKKISSVTYPGSVGSVTTEIHAEERNISLGFDFDMAANENLSDIILALDNPGLLTVNRSGKEKRYIYCNSTELSVGEKHGRLLRIVLQMRCDYPYFYGEEMTIPIYRINKLLNSSFSFPGEFSTRVNDGGAIYNAGTADCEPIIVIRLLDTPPNTVSDIRIENEDTGQVICLEAYTFSAGDSVTVNIPERTVVNQNGESIIQYISDDTFLNGFTLLAGNNSIRVSVSNPLLKTDITLTCKSFFREALY